MCTFLLQKWCIAGYLTHCGIFRWSYWNILTTFLITIMALPLLIKVKWLIDASVNQPNIGSNNGLSPIRHQTIIWTNADLFTIRLLEQMKCQWNFTRNSNAFQFKKIHLEILSKNGDQFVPASMCLKWKMVYCAIWNCTRHFGCTLDIQYR